MTGFRQMQNLHAYSGGTVRDSHPVFYSPAVLLPHPQALKWNINLRKEYHACGVLSIIKQTCLYCFVPVLRLFFPYTLTNRSQNTSNIRHHKALIFREFFRPFRIFIAIFFVLRDSNPSHSAKYRILPEQSRIRYFSFSPCFAFCAIRNGCQMPRKNNCAPLWSVLI